MPSVPKLPCVLLLLPMVACAGDPHGGSTPGDTGSVIVRQTPGGLELTPNPAVRESERERELRRQREQIDREVHQSIPRPEELLRLQQRTGG